MYEKQIALAIYFRKQTKTNPVAARNKNKTAKIKSYQERAKQLFKKPPYTTDSTSSSESADHELTIKQLQNELADLKKQLSDAGSLG